MAREDPATARSITRPCRIERPGDRHRLDVRPAGRVVRARGTAKERAEALRALTDLADERRADCVRSRLHRHTNLKTGIDGVHPVSDDTAVALGLLGVTADGGDERALAVDRDLDLMRVLEPS